MWGHRKPLLSLVGLCYLSFFAASVSTADDLVPWQKLVLRHGSITAVGSTQLFAPVVLPTWMRPAMGAGIVESNQKQQFFAVCLPISQTAAVQGWASRFPSSFPIEALRSVHPKRPPHIHAGRAMWVYTETRAKGPLIARVMIFAEYNPQQYVAVQDLNPSHNSLSDDLAAELPGPPQPIVVLVVQFWKR